MVCVSVDGLGFGGGVGGRCIGKHQGELASERQASWQADGLLIMQGLSPRLEAVSNMRGHNQPLKNRNPQFATYVCVCVLCKALCELFPGLFFI